MTDEELKRIEADYEAAFSDDMPHHHVELIAEIRRLRELVKEAEWADGTQGVSHCPWCGAEGWQTKAHFPSCAAFTPDGQVR